MVYHPFQKSVNIHPKNFFQYSRNSSVDNRPNSLHKRKITVSANINKRKYVSKTHEWSCATRRELNTYWGMTCERCWSRSRPCKCRSCSDRRLDSSRSSERTLDNAITNSSKSYDVQRVYARPPFPWAGPQGHLSLSASCSKYPFLYNSYPPSLSLSFLPLPPYIYPFPFSLSLSPPPFPSSSLSPSLPFPLIQIEGMWAPTAGSRAEPQPKLNLVHFKWKIWHLMRIISVTFMKNYNDFPMSLANTLLKKFLEHLLQRLYSVDYGIAEWF